MSQPEPEYELVGDDTLPDFPTPVVVTDKDGKDKWTISIPLGFRFPLKLEEYLLICQETEEIAQHVREELYGEKYAAPKDYYYNDPHFLDVVEADRNGLLMTPNQAAGIEYKARNPNAERMLVGEERVRHAQVCARSMTMLLETPNAGFGQTLMMLWTAYGLAQKEDRAFFVDDSRWAYGKYQDYFELPPSPDCRPPPRHEIVPCPHQARHLVVSDSTRSIVFGDAFNLKFDDAAATGVKSKEAAYKLARQGYEALFKLKDDDLKHVKSRLSNPSLRVDGGRAIGVHVRHGDRHPFEPQYQDSYIPTFRYTEALEGLFGDTFNASDSAAERLQKKQVVLIATDDPSVYTEEFSSAIRAQTLIRLANKPKSSAADISEKDLKVGMFKKFIETPIGWEGGFHAPMFWSLGKTETVGSDQGALQEAVPDGDILVLRGLVGRAYLLDLAVLAGASDAVVCTVSAMGCKLLAVMMGWEKVVQGWWKNVDGEGVYGWSAVSY